MPSILEQLKKFEIKKRIQIRNLEFVESLCRPHLLGCESDSFNLIRLPCSCNVCNKCIEKINKQKCDLHEIDLSLNETEAVDLTFGDILQMNVYCSNRKLGCQEFDSLNSIQFHDNECCYKAIDCPLDCLQKIQRKDMEKHLKEECQNRNVTCSYCNNIITSKYINEHHARCNFRHEKCPYCAVEINLSMLDAHTAQCDHRPVECAFKNLGCDYTDKKINMEQHEKIKHNSEYLCQQLVKSEESIQNINEHYQTMMRHVMNQEQINERLEEQLNQIKANLLSKDPVLRDTQLKCQSINEEIEVLKQKLFQLSKYEKTVNQLQKKFDQKIEEQNEILQQRIVLQFTNCKEEMNQLQQNINQKIKEQNERMKLLLANYEKKLNQQHQNIIQKTEEQKTTVQKMMLHFISYEEKLNQLQQKFDQKIEEQNSFQRRITSQLSNYAIRLNQVEENFNEGIMQQTGKIEDLKESFEGKLAKQQIHFEQKIDEQTELLQQKVQFSNYVENLDQLEEFNQNEDMNIPDSETDRSNLITDERDLSILNVEGTHDEQDFPISNLEREYTEDQYLATMQHTSIEEDSHNIIKKFEITTEDSITLIPTLSYTILKKLFIFFILYVFLLIGGGIIIALLNIFDIINVEDIYTFEIMKFFSAISTCIKNEIFNINRSSSKFINH